MWSAFMNGSGLHGGGGGAGGGYVQSQGWEFVPCARRDKADRGKGRNHSPLRRISSPPTVFRQNSDGPICALPGGTDVGAGTPGEMLREQMWPSPEQQQQQKAVHSRLKKKFEDLKKQHVQDKENWIREKESLLREVANIQGGENRRILLDLKTVLDEVQAEVKREEEKRSDLQLQYTRDRCAWELERAELKCRIAQLEAREASGLVNGGPPTAVALRSVEPLSTREFLCETSTLRREREEQRRILADTHSAAMDLRTRLEHSERDWLQEKAELLERFDMERLEWESQLKDMQRKIEELYSEVRAKHGGPKQNGQKFNEDILRLSLRSTSTGSSLLSDNSHSDLLSCSTHSEPTRSGPSLHDKGIPDDVARDKNDPYSICFQADNLCGLTVGDQMGNSNCLKPEVTARGTQKERLHDEEIVDVTELEAVCFGLPGFEGILDLDLKCEEKGADVSFHENPLYGTLNYGSDKKKNTTALNAALREIARVSEELCSYQDEIKKKSHEKGQSDLANTPDRNDLKLSKSLFQRDEAPYDFSRIYQELRALERENWLTLSPDHTWQSRRGFGTLSETNTDDLDIYKISSNTFGLDLGITDGAPPIPPRSSSWNLSTPDTDVELFIPESPAATLQKCHAPGIVLDRKCSSPSVVRKFEAMLQENEGKVLKDGIMVSCSPPGNSSCNISCCHNRWSCDPSKFTQNKLSTYSSVQKSFSEVNILSAAKDSLPDSSASVAHLPMAPAVTHFPVDLLLSSLESPPHNPVLQGSKRNIMLEKKTAEFNRTMFQAEMGHQADSLIITEVSSLPDQPILTSSDDISPLTESSLEPISANTTPLVDSVSKESSSPSTTDLHLQPVKEKLAADVQEANMEPGADHQSKHESELSRYTSTVTTSADFHDLKNVRRTSSPSSSPSRKAPHRLGSELFYSESVSPERAAPNHPMEEFKKGCPSQEKPVRADGRSQQRKTTQQRHLSRPPQPDSIRPVPRVLSDHPWKPLTLAAYPRPEGSRSNYGAVERILKNYESAAWAQQNHTSPFSSSICGVEENITERPGPDSDTLPLPCPLGHTAQMQVSSSGVKSGKEPVGADEDSSIAASSSQKNFSRPACPANRRLPSRWASRSSDMSPSSGASLSSSPAVPRSFPRLQKNTSSFTYTHAFHLETAICQPPCH